MPADLLVPELTELRREHVMGTALHVIVRGDPDAGVAACARIDVLERRWSRFIATSDVTLLNGAGGRPLAIHPDTLLLLDRCRLAGRRTWGLFDASVLPAVRAAGYTDSYAALDAAAVLAAHPVPSSGLAGMETDGLHARLPVGVQVDPGGLGKGLAADLAAHAALGAGASGVLVNLGGDLRAAGTPPPGGWLVDVESPFQVGETITTLSLSAGAVATSSRTHRVLGPGHHLIDPVTGAPARSGLAQATVLAGEGWWAEALATAAFIGGQDLGADLVTRHGAAAILVTDSGEFISVGDLDRFRC
ncbi:MAG TPA: FAD:protein FMN transferase [Mycobacteriales bacterium]|nr:FAD:protein FMN transferase [Mycobacteriales bacterium]